MRIGILGGTFDPIHQGHLYLAVRVLDKLSLNKIIFIPTNIPPHKKNVGITAPRHRYNMVRLGIADNRKFAASDIEIKRKGRSYSIETLRQLKERYPPSTEIFFITGSDSLNDLDQWKNITEIMRLCKFVVVKRPAFKIKNAPSFIRDHCFILLSIRAKDISSTDIRNRIKSHQSISRLVPESVNKYIEQYGLYRF
ncbi:MAG: nicotinate-nucleotide adenylyltransferase [Candidatus Omnitrophica bacterium]|nr:nicotinate-nucleotide adenylyltransferase [Candidatus Omnitrophota bacterium]MBU1853527.1 nicotinate-nucleotide adenylyltransferase [Candidatus Omnitrophota bacterium]